MKINRYAAGQSNVQQLQRAAGSVRSPDFMASREGGKYFAIGDAAQGIAQNLEYVQQVKQRTEDAQDNALAQTHIANAQAALDKASKLAEIENWQPDRYEREVDAILKGFQDSAKMVSERNRGVYQNEFQQQVARWRGATEVESTVIRAKFANRQLFDAFKLSVDSGNLDHAQRIVMAGRDSGVFSPEAADKYESIIGELRVENQATQLYDGFEDARAIGREDAYYEKLVNDLNMDPEVKSKALTKIESQMENVKAIEGKKRIQMRGELERRKTDLLVAIKQNQAGTGDIEAFVTAIDALGDDKLSETASGWRNELYLASLSEAKGRVEYGRIDDALQMSIMSKEPGWLQASAANRKDMDAYLKDRVLTPDMTPQQAAQAEVDFVRMLGVPTENIYEQWKAGANALAPQSLINAAEIWNTLRGTDGVVRVDDGLEVGERAVIIDVANKIQAGVAPEAAAQQTIDTRQTLRDLPEETQRLISTKFAEIDVAAKFEQIAEPWLALDPDIFNTTVAQGLYQSYLYDAFVSIGGRDADTAIEAANQQFRQQFRETRINGKKEWQDGGIAGEESEQLGRTLFEQDLKGQRFMTTDGQSKLMVTLDEQADVSFRNPYKVDGVTKYHVYYKDAPLMSEDGRSTVRISVDSAAFDAWQGSAKGVQRQELIEQIEALEADLQQAQRMRENIYRKGEMATRLRDIPKEIERLRGQIAELER